MSKKTIVKRDLGAVKVNWVALQETKLRIVDRSVVNQVCGRGD